MGDEVWKSLKVRVYQSEKAGAAWEEYVKWKGGLEMSEGGEEDEEE